MAVITGRSRLIRRRDSKIYRRRRYPELRLRRSGQQRAQSTEKIGRMKEDSRNNAKEVKGSLSQVPALSDQPIERRGVKLMLLSLIKRRYRLRALSDFIQRQHLRVLLSISEKILLVFLSPSRAKGVKGRGVLFEVRRTICRLESAHETRVRS